MKKNSLFSAILIAIGWGFIGLSLLLIYTPLCSMWCGITLILLGIAYKIGEQNKE